MSEVELMRNDIFALVMMWYEQTGEALKLHVVNQRYARKAKNLGVRLIDVVSSDARLSYRMSRKGAVLIAPRERIESEYGDKVGSFWTAHGVPL